MTAMAMLQADVELLLERLERKLMDEGCEPQSLREELIDDGFTDVEAAALVGAASARGRQAALRGEHGCIAFAWEAKNRPFANGWPTAVVTVATLPVTFAAAFAGLSFFSPGTYPRLLLAVPGIAFGAIFWSVGMFAAYVVRRMGS